MSPVKEAMKCLEVFVIDKIDLWRFGCQQCSLISFWTGPSDSPYGVNLYWAVSACCDKYALEFLKQPWNGTGKVDYFGEKQERERNCCLWSFICVLRSNVPREITGFSVCHELSRPFVKNNRWGFLYYFPSQLRNVHSDRLKIVFLHRYFCPCRQS